MKGSGSAKIKKNVAHLKHPEEEETSPSFDKFVKNNIENIEILSSKGIF